MTLTILNPTTNRSTDYTDAYLTKEARRMVKMTGLTHTKFQGWQLHVIEGLGAVQLRAHFLTIDGTAKITTQTL